MMAWISPERIVRSTPCRMGLGPSFVSTETRRLLISRVDICASSLLWSGYGGAACSGAGVDGHVDVDEHPLAVDGDRIDGDRLGGRQAGRTAGAQVEGRPVQPALEGGAVSLADVVVPLHVGADVIQVADIIVYDTNPH